MSVNRQKLFHWHQKPGENTEMNYSKPTHWTFFSYRFTRESSVLRSASVKFLNELRLWAGECTCTFLTPISCCELW